MGGEGGGGGWEQEEEEVDASLFVPNLLFLHYDTLCLFPACIVILGKLNQNLLPLRSTPLLLRRDRH